MNASIDLKFLIARCFTILYRESQQNNKVANSKDEIRKLMGEVNIQESNLPNDKENRVIYALKNYVLEMTRKPDEEQYDYNEVIQRIQLICEDDYSLFETLKNSISLTLDEKELTSCLLSLKKELKNFTNNKNILNILSKANTTLKYKPHLITDEPKFVLELISELTPFAERDRTDDDPAIISEVDFSKTEEIATVLTTVKKEADGDAIIKTPWQALNRMLRGGLRRGQLMTVSALQHNNKSGLTLGILCGAALYNNPLEQMIDVNKKPMILLISAEDEMPKLIGSLYVLLKENLDNERTTDKNIAVINEVEAAKYISEKLSINGYYFKALRVNPSEWTYLDIFDYINKQESEGYEIHLLNIDYLNMFPKTGCRGDGEPARIQNLFQVVRNFISSKKISTITPHQLSGDAMELFRQGKSRDLVNLVAGGNYYADCRGISREVDCELFIHIVNENGRFYQAIRRGKHRIIGKTPEKDLYTILPFEEVGALRFDVDKQDTSVTRFGSKRRSDGTEELPFYDDDY